MIPPSILIAPLAPVSKKPPLTSSLLSQSIQTSGFVALRSGHDVKNQRLHRALAVLEVFVVVVFFWLADDYLLAKHHTRVLSCKITS